VKKKVIFISLGAAICLSALAAVYFYLIWNGFFLLNHPSKSRYPVRGVDVSHYQGDINWETLASQDISFAFIKATEGSSSVDSNFAYNYEQAQTTNLRIGAYHFFSYDSEGRTQAENFIANVEKMEGMLPPVVDLEFYGDKEINLPVRENVHEQLDVLLKELEDYYGMKPMIYATEKSYSLYLSGAYKDYDIWIRNVISKPHISDGRKWTFWQYTNRGRLKGYEGEEPYIDINVFNGTEQEFERYAK